MRLRHGQADSARFQAAVNRLNADGAGVQDLDRPAAAITASIRPQAVGWQVLAALAGLVGLAVVGQALARQAAAESTDHPALATLGLSPRQFAAQSMLRVLAAAVAGAGGAIVVATLLSPLAPADELLARAIPGPAGQAALAGHIGRHRDNATRPVVPEALVNFGESANFPLLLGGIVTLCGLATLGRLFAVSLGVVPVPVVPAWPLAAVAAGVLVTANVLAAIPAVSAARARPGRLLRTE